MTKSYCFKGYIPGIASWCPCLRGNPGGRCLTNRPEILERPDLIQQDKPMIKNQGIHAKKNTAGYFSVLKHCWQNPPAKWRFWWDFYLWMVDFQLPCFMTGGYQNMPAGTTPRRLELIQENWVKPTYLLEWWMMVDPQKYPSPNCGLFLGIAPAMIYQAQMLDDWGLFE